jgi:hypothetical protein
MDEVLMDEVIMDEVLMDEVKKDEELMEECIICFDETETFIVFICNHKTCKNCYPKIMQTRPNCPLCNRELVINPQIITPFTLESSITRDSPFRRDIQIDSGPVCSIFIFICIIGSLIFFMSVIGGSIYIREK